MLVRLESMRSTKSDAKSTCLSIEIRCSYAKIHCLKVEMPHAHTDTITYYSRCEPNVISFSCTVAVCLVSGCFSFHHYLFEGGFHGLRLNAVDSAQLHSISILRYVRYILHICRIPCILWIPVFIQINLRNMFTFGNWNSTLTYTRQLASTDAGKLYVMLRVFWHC